MSHEQLTVVPAPVAASNSLAASDSPGVHYASLKTMTAARAASMTGGDRQRFPQFDIVGASSP